MKNNQKRPPNKKTSQVAALCYDLSDRGKLQILLITSRRSKRWIVPKGWPVKGLKPYETAEKEAFEEAGVVGDVLNFCIGKYSYVKEMEDSYITCNVAVYPLKVNYLLDNYKEKEERENQWMTQKDAWNAVIEPELRHIIKTFSPKILLNSISIN